MSALDDAQSALAVAQLREQDARDTFNGAEQHARSLRQRVTTDTATDITPADITEADAAVEHARLVFDGATAALPALSEAVRLARADELCDEILRTAPELGAAIRDALDDIERALDAFREPALAYERFIESSQQRIATYGHANPRATISRYGPTKVDRFVVSSCRPASQLAAALLPAMRSVGAPQYQLEHLAELARAAPALPTIPTGESR
jgi:hypothetical protein